MRATGSWLVAAVVLLGLLSYSLADCVSDLQALENEAYVDSTTSQRMRQSTGQGDYGFFAPIGGGLDPGQWGTCTHFGSDVAEYCMITHQGVQNNTVGTCIPPSCTEEDLEDPDNSELVNSALRLPSDFQRGPMLADCRQATYDWPWYTWFFLSIIAVLALLAIAGTLADIQISYGWPYSPAESDDEEQIVADFWSDSEKLASYGGINDDEEEEEMRKQSESARKKDLAYAPLVDKHPSLLLQMLLSFSIPFNFSRLCASPAAGSMDVLNGIRVVAMAGVVLGHTFYYIWDTMPFQDLPYIVDVASTMRFQTVSACFFAVDTFFWLSGFLIAYLFIKELRSKGLRIITIPMMYVHRVLRLTPTLAFGVFFFWLVTPYWSEGPYWRFYQAYVFNKCPTGWYWTLLYLQNVVPFLPDGLNASFCMGWAWYLADDMQYFLLSPFILLIYHKNRWAGWAVCLFLTVACICINVGITWGYNIQPFSVFEHIEDGDTWVSPTGKYAPLIYFPPWTRFGPYVIGFMTAFILLERGENFRVPLVFRYIIYVCSVVVLVIVSYITWTNMHYGWQTMQNVIYLGFSRTAWSVALGALCLLSIVGYGGVFNHFFGSSLWVPLARLTYSAYIYHLGMLVTSYMGSRTVFVYSTQTVLYYFLGHLCNAFGLAFINYLLVEKPFMNIEALLLLPKKKKN